MLLAKCGPINCRIQVDGISNFGAAFGPQPGSNRADMARLHRHMTVPEIRFQFAAKLLGAKVAPAYVCALAGNGIATRRNDVQMRVASLLMQNSAHVFRV